MLSSREMESSMRWALSCPGNQATRTSITESTSVLSLRRWTGDSLSQLHCSVFIINYSVMNRESQQYQPSQGPGFSGRTRIILPGEEGDPNRVIIPGQQNYINNPYHNNNNMYQQNNDHMYQHNSRDNMYSQNNYPLNHDKNDMYQNRNNNPFRNNNLFSNNNNNPFNSNSNQMFSPKNNNRKSSMSSSQQRRNMMGGSRSAGLLPRGDPRCMYQLGQINTTASPGSCQLCARSR